ncbi:rhp7, partial [Mucuna pruriens]
MVQTKTTPKPDAIPPLTPAQTREPSSLSTATSLPLSVPLRRRSLRLRLRLASLSDSGPSPTATPDSAVRVSTGNRKQKSHSTSSQEDERGNGFLNLRSGKKVLKRAMTNDSEQQGNKANDDDSADKSDDVAVAVDGNVMTSEKVLKRAMTDDSEQQGYNANDDDSAEKRDDVAVVVDGNVIAENSGVDLIADNAPSRRSRNSNARERGSGSGSRRNVYMERFHDIARENASRFALFEEENDDRSPPVAEPARDEIEDWPGPFSTAMKIIRDRGTKLQNAQASSQTSLCESISWVPKAKRRNVGDSVSIPSLQETCVKILVKNVDAIASLESVPDALRHRLSQLLCDSRRINTHFFELLVRGAPTEIRLRDCSWLTEEQFTECFRMCDTGNLVVLQLDQCGRCLPDYVIVATLAQSPRHLSRLTTLSLSGACRLSDGGLRALVSSAPALRSINLSQCSLLTSASIYILAESLRSLLKELYLDDCQGIDAALIVPALIELEHLEVLSVAGIQTVCDEFVKNYIIARGQNMKELVLKDCINLTDASIKVIVEHCPGLCALDLMNLSKLTDLSIGYLTNGGCTLHTLKLCRNPFSDEAIAAFVETSGGSLKELSLNNIKKVTDAFVNGHSNLQIQIIGLKMSPVLQHVKVPDPHQGALNYSSVSV